MPAVTQHEIVVAYSSWLDMKEGLLIQSKEVDWPAINTEIVQRFGFGGLKKIKKQAWHLAAQKVAV